MSEVASTATATDEAAPARPAAPIRPSRLSPTAIDRYRRCPKEYWFAHVARQAVAPTSSPTLVVGNAVHHALERFFGLPTDAREPANLERALRAVWPQHRQKGTFATREEEAAAGQEALRLLATFGDRFDLTTQPLAREQWLVAPIGNGTSVHGKVDRIDEAPGGISIVDYKTGRQLIDADDLPQNSAAIIYLLAAEKAFDKPVVRVRFIYLAHGAEVVWEPEREDVAAAQQRLARIAHEIATTEEFVATPGPHCRFCPWALQCPDRQHVSLADLIPVEGLPF